MLDFSASLAAHSGDHYEHQDQSQDNSKSVSHEYNSFLAASVTPNVAGLHSQPGGRGAFEGLDLLQQLAQDPGVVHQFLATHPVASGDVIQMAGVICHPKGQIGALLQVSHRGPERVLERFPLFPRPVPGRRKHARCGTENGKSRSPVSPTGCRDRWGR